MLFSLIHRLFFTHRVAVFYDELFFLLGDFTLQFNFERYCLSTLLISFFFDHCRGVFHFPLYIFYFIIHVLLFFLKIKAS